MTAPVVFARGGAVCANSRDVAAFFQKAHRNVLRDIDKLIEQEPTLGQGGMLTFEQTPYVEPVTGQTYRAYAMSRDGFSLLAMGFTGAAALRWKVRYIEAFNAMEAHLRAAPVDLAAALGNPEALRGLLLGYTEKVIALEAQVDTLRPQAEALERIALSDGSLCITDAAKTMQVRPKTLFTHLRAHGWIYSRAGSAEIAYQDKIASGHLEHKTTTIHRTDGTEKTVTQVRVTPKGLTRLARELAPAQRALA